MRHSPELRLLVLGFFNDSGGMSREAVQLFSKSDECTFVGSDAGEFIVGGPEIRGLLLRQIQELEQVGPVKVDVEEVHAFEEGDVGWVVSQGTFELVEGVSFRMRVTHIFHREDGAWRVVHAHSSIPASNVEVLGIELTTAIDEIAALVEQERPDLTPVASPEGTLTIMFTDMEASTATNEALGDDRFLPLLLRHNEIVEGHTRAVGGTVVKSQGDGFMLAFSSARKAVECAMCVQRDVTELSEQLRVRMGLHTGEPVRHAEDFYGRDVAYAARLGSAAQGGEILVSALVKALVEPSGSVAFDGPRELELKGFDGPQPVYSVEW